ncbi:prepilin peptidase [Subtercola boreus]|uniref:Prepilin type IV endopeptidase peptidase domain-containing protein n=1 Tax=Subtercola boreus TaxID=120213 RepID=A0A3E0WB01_9MICO|nr:prepilin peptidase [Subtercola boreus]RFA20026.1 hypothetical protein B7R24_10625 [Subtercola boreus]RFA20155.1 hypothetical protein B7R23_10565 [Subtercola boreus]RFA26482.1 hypothetical protein B7R25_10690 [Subtercola boreus]
MLASLPLAAIPFPPDLATVLTLAPVAYVAAVTPALVIADLRHRRLPNVLVLPGLAVVAVAAAVGALCSGLDATCTALVAFVTLVVFATLRLAGALATGDVKLAVLLAAALAPVASASLALYLLAGSIAALGSGLTASLLLLRAYARGALRPSSLALGPFLLFGFWAALTAAVVQPHS